MRFGPSVLDRQHARFDLWAPGVEHVSLQFAGRAPLPMQKAETGWFAMTAECTAGARYRFVLPDGRAVPDPASRFQPEDIAGPSELCAVEDYSWRHAQWRGRPWHETVIYELHAGLCGGFVGIEQRLPDFVRLGITALELMPIAEFPGQRNWGYDGVLLYAPDSAYGRPEALKRMIDAAHQLGLMVFLDVVYNHFGPEGNYLAAYAPQFFREDRSTPWGAAIDFRRPEVRQFYIQNALYWVQDFRIDGLRFDAVHAIEDVTFLPELALAVRSATSGRHVHLMLENEQNEAALLDGAPDPPPRRAIDSASAHDAKNVGPTQLPRQLFNAQWNDDAHNALHVILTDETEGYYVNYAMTPSAHLARCLSEGFSYQGEESPTHRKPRGSSSAALPPCAFIFFLQNHDQTGNRAFGERLTVLAQPDALRVAVVLQVLCPQIPLLFMGEEYASRTPFLFFTDFQDELAQQVREGRRREFAAFPAFADATRRAQIPDPNAESTFSRSRPVAGDSATFAFYQELLSLRRDRLVPRLPGARSLGAAVIGARALSARWQLGDGSKLQLVANFGSDPVLSVPVDMPVLYATHAELPAVLARGDLPATSCCVFLQESV